MLGFGVSVGEPQEGRLTAALKRAGALPTALTASVLKPDPDPSSFLDAFDLLASSPSDLFAPSTRVTLDVHWHRLVAHYKDGRVLKGFGRDFLPTYTTIDLWPGVSSPSHLPITVHLAHLKAVFFVYELDGGGGPVEFDRAPAAGRRITVTFADGEVLEGTTADYAADAAGFFVTPIDDDSNNERIFVVNTAGVDVQFA